MAAGCVDSIFKAQCANFYDIIETDNYAILSTMHNFHFQEYSIFVYQFGLKTCRT